MGGSGIVEGENALAERPAQGTAVAHISGKCVTSRNEKKTLFVFFDLLCFDERREEVPKKHNRDISGVSFRVRSESNIFLSCRFGVNYLISHPHRRLRRLLFQLSEIC